MPIRWEKSRKKTHWRDRDYLPWLTHYGRYKTAIWYQSGVLEIRDNRYSWVLRLLGASDPRQTRYTLGSLTDEDAIMALRKIERAAGGSSNQIGPNPEDAEHYPALWEHLSATRWPDGSPRETSSIVIVGGSGEWKGCVSDKANARVCWKACATVEGLLLALSLACEVEEPRDWRAASDYSSKKKR
jgi:hypothetical protein